MDDLIAQIEAGSESRELNVEIFQALHPGETVFLDCEFEGCTLNGKPMPDGVYSNVPSYTSNPQSRAAAVTALKAQLR